MTKREENIKAIQSHEELLTDLGLSACLASARKMVALLEDSNAKWGDLHALSEELVGRLVDETVNKVFFGLTLRESDFYQHPYRGWDLITTRFPETLQDIEEAAKCYALSRYPASVFHTIQVIEAGLIELGTFIGVADPHSGWTAVSNKLNQILKKNYGDLTEFEKANRPFLEQVNGTVEALKTHGETK
jgi:hypothetical protein